MESKEIFVPITLESIEPVVFPDVALYIKTGGNYVLYKNNGRDFSAHDHERLSKNGVEFVFVSKNDMDVITSHMEASAERMLKGDILTSRAKGKMIYQTSINFVNDIFNNPDKSTDLDRTKRLIENLMLYLSDSPDAINSLETVMSHNYYTFVHSLQVASLTLLIHSEAYALPRDEMLDVGSGYPLGLGGTEIPRSAQITGIADVYCTLTNDNHGNKTMPPHIAVQLMRNQMKNLFSPNLLDTLEKLVCTEDVQQFIL